MAYQHNNPKGQRRNAPKHAEGGTRKGQTFAPKSRYGKDASTYAGGRKPWDVKKPAERKPWDVRGREGSKPQAEPKKAWDEKPRGKWSDGTSFGDGSRRKPLSRKTFNKKSAFGGEKRPWQAEEERRSFAEKKRRMADIEAKNRERYERQLKKDVSLQGDMRLNRFLANAGICSRREADEYIKAGVVSVNGVVVSELGVKVKPSDRVMFHNDLVRLEHKVYILLNKPKDCVTTMDDPQGRISVNDLVKDACAERVYPVGRLDRNTTGLLLLTNDGELAAKLTHPKYNKKKIYHVGLNKPLEETDFAKIVVGVELEDGPIKADALEYVSENKKEIGIEIHSGRNRIVRRIFESLGYRVERLDRVYFAGLTKKNLPRGKYRFLTERELAMLNMGAYE